MSGAPTTSGVVREPVRLLAGGGSPFERRLIESVAAERISEESEQRLAQRLNVAREELHAAPTNGTTPNALPSAVARHGQLATLAGWGAIGLVAAFLVSR
jgi:hypothetical protein